MASQACCDAGPPVHVVYDKKGAMTEKEGVTMYETGSGKLGIIFIHDIFGLVPNQVRSTARLPRL